MTIKSIWRSLTSSFLRTGLFEVACIIFLKCVMEVPCFLLTVCVEEVNTNIDLTKVICFGILILLQNRLRKKKFLKGCLL